MELAAQLAELEKTLLVRRLVEEDPAYAFRHTLIQEVAYASLLKNDRRGLHRIVGFTLERSFPDRLDEFAPMLAHHFQEGEVPERAYAYAVRAGDRAARLLAHQEAIAHYEMALQTAAAMPQRPADSASVLVRLGREHELTARYPEALRLYDSLEAEASRSGDSAGALQALLAKTTLLATPTPMFNLEEAEHVSSRALGIAQGMEDEPSQAKILWQKMLVEFFAGRLEAAVRFGEKAIEISRRLGLKEQLAYCLNDICSLYGTVGRIADGFLAAEEARRLWIELGNQPMLTDVLSNVSFYHYFRGNFEEARKASEEAHSLSVRIDNSWGRSFSRMFIGIAYLDRGEIDQAMEAMHESLEFSLVSGFVVPQVFVRSFLGFTYAYLGQRERGLALLDEADLVGRARLPSWSFWPAMLRGLVELRSGHLPEAEAIFNPAGQPAPWTDEHNWLAIFMPVSLLLCHLELARANFSAALEQAKRLFQVLDSSGVEAHRMEALHLKGRALQGLGQRDEALQTARSAVEFGRKKELRRILWESLALTAELEEEHGDNVRAQALRQEARQVLQAILGSIPEADLRESFQCSPGVRGMLERTESSSSD